MSKVGSAPFAWRPWPTRLRTARAGATGSRGASDSRWGGRRRDRRGPLQHRERTGRIASFLEQVGEPPAGFEHMVLAMLAQQVEALAVEHLGALAIVRGHEDVPEGEVGAATVARADRVDDAERAGGNARRVAVAAKRDERASLLDRELRL